MLIVGFRVYGNTVLINNFYVTLKFLKIKSILERYKNPPSKIYALTHYFVWLGGQRELLSFRKEREALEEKGYESSIHMKSNDPMSSSMTGLRATVTLCIKTRNCSLLGAVIYHTFSWVVGSTEGARQLEILNRLLNSYCSELFLFTSLQKLMLSLLSHCSQSSVHIIPLEADDTRSLRTYD